MSRPWRNRDALLLGHSQMEGLAPHFVERLRQTRARTIHQYIERGLNLPRLMRDVRYRRRQVLESSIADRLPFAMVALSGNGAVTRAAELESLLYWLCAEYPRATIAWLGHTITRSADPADDEERARAAELEAQLVPTTLEGFLWIDMRLPSAPLAPDGIHLTREGYRQLADHAWTQILTATREPPSPTPWGPFLLGGAALGLTAAIGYRAWQSREAREARGRGRRRTALRGLAGEDRAGAERAGEESAGEGGPWR